MKVACSTIRAQMGQACISSGWKHVQTTPCVCQWQLTTLLGTSRRGTQQALAALDVLWKIFPGKLEAPVESCAEALLPSSTGRLSGNGMERHCQASTSASNAFLPLQPRLASLAAPGPCPPGRAVMPQQQDQAAWLTKPRTALAA